MPIHRPLFALLALIGCCATSLWGQLSFTEERIEHTASPGETSFEARFPFENKSDETVTVVDVRSSCGCTVPELDKKTYAPGEKGEILAVFTYGSRTGRQNKTITVTTDHGTQRVQLSVMIPQKWTVEPRIQTWRMDEAPSAKAIVVQFKSVTPEAVSLGDYPKDRFTAESSWNAEAKTFTVNFTPTTVETGRVQRASVEVTLPGGAVESIPIYLRVY